MGRQVWGGAGETWGIDQCHFEVDLEMSKPTSAMGGPHCGARRRELRHCPPLAP